MFFFVYIYTIHIHILYIKSGPCQNPLACTWCTAPLVHQCLASGSMALQKSNPPLQFASLQLYQRKPPICCRKLHACIGKFILNNIYICKYI